MSNNRIIVALDYAEASEALTLIKRLGDRITFYKIGPQLLLSGGLYLCHSLIGQGKRVFLDLKLHDIETTVAYTTERAAKIGVTFLTVHGYCKTMRAAIIGRADSPMKLLAVTVLTDWTDQDCRDACYCMGVAPLAAIRAGQAEEMHGIDGLICSPHEVTDIRDSLDTHMILVTPGVRPPETEHNDQRRVKTPKEAIDAGADYLVIGRPITRAEDPVAATESIIASLE